VNPKFWVRVPFGSVLYGFFIDGTGENVSVVVIWYGLTVTVSTS